jgi:hypothetical protein
VLDGVVDMRYGEDGEEQVVILGGGDVFVAGVGCEHVAHPRGEARIPCGGEGRECPKGERRQPPTWRLSSRDLARSGQAVFRLNQRSRIEFRKSPVRSRPDSDPMTESIPQ